MWASLSDEELVRTSELIVLGEWQGQTTLSTSGLGTLNLGVIAVTETLKGLPNTRVVFVALPAASAPRSSSDIHFKQGDRGLWLLRLRPESTGIYLADHPQRFVPLIGNEARIKQLRQKL